jgi:hypothetical protein
VYRAILSDLKDIGPTLTAQQHAQVRAGRRPPDARARAPAQGGGGFFPGAAPCARGRRQAPAARQYIPPPCRHGSAPPRFGPPRLPPPAAPGVTPAQVVAQHAQRALFEGALASSVTAAARALFVPDMASEHIEYAKNILVGLARRRLEAAAILQRPGAAAQAAPLQWPTGSTSSR